MLRNDRKAETLFNHHFPTSLSPSFEMLKTSEKNMNYSSLLGAKENTVELFDRVSLGVEETKCQIKCLCICFVCMNCKCRFHRVPHYDLSE